MPKKIPLLILAAVLCLSSRVLWSQSSTEAANFLNMPLTGDPLLPHPLTQGTEGCGYPAFSKDGKRIAYVRAQHIATMTLNGKNIQDYWHFNGLGPVWSPDDAKIAYFRPGSTVAIWIGEFLGERSYSLVPDVTNQATRSGDQYPCWSRDGKFIVWTHDGQLWITDLEGKSPHAFTHQAPAGYEHCGDWSPDGKRLAYVSGETKDLSQGVPYKIKLIDSDGRDEEFFGSGVPAYGVKWSQDGKWLYYNSGSAIMRVRLSSPTQLEKVLDWPNRNSNFDISPDGRWIVYDDQSDDGPSAIYKRQLPDLE